MTNRILELTEKIYNEGVVKAKKHADTIVSDAKEEADEIIRLAKEQKLEILEQAKNQAEELKNNTNSEIQLAARQFISKLKLQITNIVTTNQIAHPTKEAFNDIKFVKNIILTLIKNWNPQNSDELNLSIVLPEKNKKEFSDFIEVQTKNILNGGIDIQFDNKASNGFKIGPKEGNYVVCFSDVDFENYFKKYLKDRTKKLLFNTK